MLNIELIQCCHEKFLPVYKSGKLLTKMAIMSIMLTTHADDIRLHEKQVMKCDFRNFDRESCIYSRWNIVFSTFYSILVHFVHKYKLYPIRFHFIPIKLYCGPYHPLKFYSLRSFYYVPMNKS